jgi:hypothetical protein
VDAPRGRRQSHDRPALVGLAEEAMGRVAGDPAPEPFFGLEEAG